MKKRDMIFVVISVSFFLFLSINTSRDQKNANTFKVNAMNASSWVMNGNPICTAKGNQMTPQACSDGAGNAIITWADQRTGHYHIYAQKVDGTGISQWAPNGTVICTATHDQGAPAVCSDGAGGAIIAWSDNRTNSNFHIYAQRVDPTGSTLWTPNGTAICTANGNEQSPLLCSDGADGAIITWWDNRTGSGYHVYAQRVDSTGATLWTGNGTAICTALNFQEVTGLCSDGAGGAIITWQDNRSATWNIYAQRVDATGVTLWSANGVGVCMAAGGSELPELCSDGAGGAIITWTDLRSGYFTHIYAQRVNAMGAMQWAGNGIGVCTANYMQEMTQICSDSAGGAIISWMDLTTSFTFQIYAQRVTGAGSLLWTSGGIQIAATGSTYQMYQEMCSNGAGGAVITWMDIPTTTVYNVYAQNVSSTGALQWSNGLAICTTSGYHELPQLCSDGAGGAFITWMDNRSANWDINAERPSNPPGSFSIYAPTGWSNSQTPAVTCEFNAGNSGVDISAVQYAYSTTGSSTPMNWAAVDGVYTDAACTVPAPNGTTGWVYAKANAVPFNQDSGTQNTIRFRATNMAGSTGTQASAAVIQVDSTAPGSFSIYSPTTWVNSQTPAIIARFTVGASGVQVSSVQFAYSTAGSSTPANWAAVTGVYTDAACTIPASNGASGTLYAKVNAVPFNQDSGTQNTIRFRATNMAGTQGTQGSASVIQIDSTAPGSFSIYSPTTWVTSQTPAVIAQFNIGVSGVQVSSVQYAYSTAGASTPTNWAAVTGVYTDAACTIPAANGAIGTVYAKVNAVPFNQDSGTQNTIRFRVTNIVGTQGTQASATVIQVDSMTPGSFAIYSPTTWVTSQTPAVIARFTVGVSGVQVSSVQYAYSIAGSSTPTNWAAVDGVYTDAACTIPALNGATGTMYANVNAVPFNQDSGVLNTIRFRATNMAGTQGTQGSASVILIDSTAPGSFLIDSPTGWVNSQTPAVVCSFSVGASGVQVSTVQYAYSTAGSSTPTNWAAVDGVYTNAACTIPSANGAIGTVYAKVNAVPFNQDSGTQNTIRFRATNIAGITGTQASAAVIQVDSSLPASFSIYSPTTWVTSQTPTVIARFNVNGVQVSTVQYAFSTTGSSTPTNWAAVDGVYTDAACTIPATNAATGWVYAKVNAVSFNQDSGTQNTICFRATDLIGNTGTQASTAVIQTDSTVPGLFSIHSPTTWVNSQTPAVIAQFNIGVSGVQVSSVQYAYSTAGASTPTNWAAVTGVYTDAACTIPAANGASGTLYAKVNAVPFNQDTGTQNTIRFRVTNMAGTQGTQASAAIIQVDSMTPGSFAIYSPTTWATSQTPAVIVQFTVGISGVQVSTVQYAYSTAGSSTPTNWAAVTGVYTDAACTIPASNGASGTVYAKVNAVLFNQDSGTQNTIRFRATNMASTQGTQGSASVIQVDSTAPGSFSIYSPTTWVNSQTPTAISRFNVGMSGVQVSTVQYSYSTTGSLTPTNWAAVDGVYTNAACTTPASNGATGWVYAKVVAVPFHQDSGSLTTIRFRAFSMATMQGIQASASIIQIDTAIGTPVDLIASPSGASSTNNFTLAWTNPQDLSGIVAAYYKLDSAPVSSTDGTLVIGSSITHITGITVSGHGNHTVYVWLVDAAGNCNCTKRSSTILQFTASTAPPNPPTSPILYVAIIALVAGITVVAGVVSTRVKKRARMAERRRLALLDKGPVTTSAKPSPGALADKGPGTSIAKPGPGALLEKEPGTNSTKPGPGSEPWKVGSEEPTAAVPAGHPVEGAARGSSTFYCVTCKRKFTMAATNSELFCPTCEQSLTRIYTCPACGIEIALKHEDYLEFKGTHVECPGCKKDVSIEPFL